MGEIFRQITIAVRGMWRYRRLGLATAWITGILGILVVMLIPDKYEASARMFVNTDTLLRPLMAGLTVAPDNNQRIEILSRILISRPNIEKLIGMSSVEALTLSKEEREKRADELIKDLQIKGTGRDQIYTITLRDKVAERAKRTVDNFTTMFIQSGQGNRDNETDVAKKFVDQQIAAYEEKLAEAEGRLKDFKQRHLGMAPGQGGDYFVRLNEANRLLTNAQLELREAEQSREALKRGLEGLEPAEEAPPPQTRPDARADLETRIEAMERDLSALLLKYTDAHPDVVGMRRRIQDLTAERDKQPSVRRTIARSTAAADQINVTLAQSAATIASLRTRVAEYEARAEKLKESATQMPQLETEFVQLNRDYDVNKKNYESLLVRRESVALSGDMQAAAGVGDFKLIDPPRVSPNPVTPNRPLLLAVALVFALGAGVAAAYGSMALHPAYYDARALREATHLPVIGTIMKAGGGGMTPERKKRIFRYCAGIGGLLLVYAAAILFVLLTMRAVE